MNSFNYSNVLFLDNEAMKATQDTKKLYFLPNVNQRIFITFYKHCLTSTPFISETKNSGNVFTGIF